MDISFADKNPKTWHHDRLTGAALLQRELNISPPGRPAGLYRLEARPMEVLIDLNGRAWFFSLAPAYSGPKVPDQDSAPAALGTSSRSQKERRWNGGGKEEREEEGK